MHIYCNVVSNHCFWLTIRKPDMSSWIISQSNFFRCWFLPFFLVSAVGIVEDFSVCMLLLIRWWQMCFTYRNRFGSMWFTINFPIESYVAKNGWTLLIAQTYGILWLGFSKRYIMAPNKSQYGKGQQPMRSWPLICLFTTLNNFRDITWFSTIRAGVWKLWYTLTQQTPDVKKTF